jgi:two-component system, NtrC family, sensor kinase
MLKESFKQHHRVLVIDDTRSIHDDIRKVLLTEQEAVTEESLAADALEAELFGGSEQVDRSSVTYEMDSAFQGQEGFTKLKQSLAEGNPYSVAIVDMRMPPGWDGVETIENLWGVYRDLQVVICTAYSDHSWIEIVQRLGTTESLLILKKPFDNVELNQMIQALAMKWSLQQETKRTLEHLEFMVQERTASLENANEHLKQEMKERERVEAELRLAQKLEAVGQLAAGIAHEINTPIQFIGDSIHFLQTSFEDYHDLGKIYQEASRTLGALPGHESWLEQIATAEDTADLEYLDEQVPKACDRALKGVNRVAEIVRAMKDFSHPGDKEKTSTDLNKALETTLVVARSEYKYVADLDTLFGRIPMVLCHPGDLNQVFLNIIVNAGHAIADVVADTGSKGRLTVATEANEPYVRVRISDTGGGIPPDIQERIWDHFFTTKAVGKGTGQGLAIARQIVVEKHGGQITFESESGSGTTFIIDIPTGLESVQDSDIPT